RDDSVDVGGAARPHARPDRRPCVGHTARAGQGRDHHAGRQGVSRRRGQHRLHPVQRTRQARVPEAGQPLARQAPRTRRTRKRPAQELANPPQAPLQPQQGRPPRQGHRRPTELRDHPRMKRGQCAEYHWALIDLDKIEGSRINYVPEKSIEARQRRQENVFRSNGPSVEVIIDEFVLKRLAVPRPVMVTQLRHMVQLVTREPRFTILVLPLDARVPPGRLPASAYTIYTFPDPNDPCLVVAETSNCLVHTTPDEVAGYE